MQHWLNNLTDIATTPGDECTLRDALTMLAKRTGFTGYAYLNIQPGLTSVVSDYRCQWQSDYFAKGYLAIDPVIKRARSIKRAFSWSSKEDQSRLTKIERSFFAHAADFGICSGLTVPIKAAHGSLALFTLASEKPAVDMDREIDPVEAASAVAQLHARIMLSDPAPKGDESMVLEPRAATYLGWIAVGKTMQEAAELEGVKYNSVRVKISETKKRFDVHTLPHLIAIAIRKKLI